MGLPTRALVALRKAKIKSDQAAREMGYERVARIPGVGEKALRVLFPEAFADRSKMLSSAELDLVRQWYQALLDLSPAMLEEADRALGNKIEAWCALSRTDTKEG